MGRVALAVTLETRSTTRTWLDVEAALIAIAHLSDFQIIEQRESIAKRDVRNAEELKLITIQIP